jgi:hypothetical protein
MTQKQRNETGIAKLANELGVELPPATKEKITLTQEQREVVVSLLTARGEDYIGSEALIETVMGWYPEATRDAVVDAIDEVSNALQFRVL